MKIKFAKIATMLTSLCAIAFAQEKGSFTDPRDNKVYKTVKIGTQTWMAENLNYNATDSKCYGQDGKVFEWSNKSGVKNKASFRTLSNAEIQANCTKYGRLYDWETAMDACPKGWHLPVDEEWTELMNFLVSNEKDVRHIPERFAIGTEYSNAGKYLKAKSGWNSYKDKSGNGIDAYNFAALPGGSSYAGEFYNIGREGYWWSATDEDEFNNSATSWNLYYNENYVDWNMGSKPFQNSVRCIKNDAVKEAQEAQYAKCTQELQAQSIKLSNDYTKCLEASGYTKCSQDIQAQKTITASNFAQCLKNSDYTKCQQEYQARMTQTQMTSGMTKCIEEYRSQIAQGIQTAMNDYTKCTGATQAIVAEVNKAITNDYTKCLEASGYTKCQQEYQAQTTKLPSDYFKCLETSGYTKCQQEYQAQTAKLSSDYTECQKNTNSKD